jgi:hypothetical protein
MLMSALGGDGQRLCLVIKPPKKESLIRHPKGSWQENGVGVRVLNTRNISYPCRETNVISSNFQSVSRSLNDVPQ